MSEEKEYPTVRDPVEAVVSNEFMTVEDVAELMLNLIAEGKADHCVTCNGEYWLAKKGDKGDIDDECLTVDLGGYDD